MKKSYELHEKKYHELLKKGILNWDDAQKNLDTFFGIEKNTLKFLEKLFSQSLLPKEGSVLELGCGTGPLLNWFYKKGFKGTGVDISETAIKIAKQNREDTSIEYFCSNILDWKPNDKQRFDLVLDGHCLHCIPYKDERKRIIQNLKTYLKENGKFILLSMCKPINSKALKESYQNCLFEKNILYTPIFNAQKFKNYKIKNNISYVPIRYIAPPESIIKEIEEEGFECCLSEIKNDSKEDCNASLIAVFRFNH